MRVLAANTSSYGPYSVDRALDGIRRSGFRWAELCVPSEGELAERLRSASRFCALLSRLKIGVVAITADGDISTSDGLQHALSLVAGAAELRVPILNVAVGNRPKAEAIEPFRENMEALLRAAGATNLEVCVEPHGALTSTGRRTWQVLESALLEKAKITYDTANVEYYGGVKAVDELPAIAERVAHVHLKDKIGGRGVWNFPPLGAGKVDLAAVLKILGNARYAGAFSVEVEFAGDPWPSPDEVDRALATSLRHVRRIAATHGVSQSSDIPPES